MGVSVVVYPLLSPPQRKFAFVLSRQLFIVKCFKGILFLGFNCCTEAYHIFNYDCWKNIKGIRCKTFFGFNITRISLKYILSTLVVIPHFNCNNFS